MQLLHLQRDRKGESASVGSLILLPVLNGGLICGGDLRLFRIDMLTYSAKFIDGKNLEEDAERKERDDDMRMQLD